MSADAIKKAAQAARRALVLIEAIDAWNDQYRGVEMSRDDLGLLLEMLQAEAQDVAAHVTAAEKVSRSAAP